jgi:catechol 2,3-dioxygenase-like lactoylglutathione lyase family enzyme
MVHDPHARETATAHFYVRNLDASVRFYVETLGFQVVRREDAHAVVALGPSVVRLVEADHGNRGRTRPRVASAVSSPLVVPNANDVYRRVRDARVVVINERRDRSSDVHDFVTVDPDGFAIRLSTAV